MALRRLPPELRELFPGDIEGNLSAGLTLTEADANAMEGRAEILCRDQLTISTTRIPAASATRQTAGAPRNARTVGSLSNLVMSANLSWSGKLDALPEGFAPGRD